MGTGIAKSLVDKALNQLESAFALRGVHGHVLVGIRNRFPLHFGPAPVESWLIASNLTHGNDPAP
jgi:hypothetical protein